MRSIVRFVMEEVTEPKRSVLKFVTDRIRACLCLLCDDKACARGLCNKHYLRFRTRFFRIADPGKRIQFENDEIREGRILHPQYVRDVLRDTGELQASTKTA